jgi:RNA polymerase sigma factor (sigma-70 family)
MHVHKLLAGGPGGLAGAARFRQAQARDRDSLNGLMVEHDGLVQAVVRRQVLGDLPFAEALQAGRIGLWHAILGYDPQRGVAFSTYAWPCMTRQVWQAVQRADRTAPQLAMAPASPIIWEQDPEVVWEVSVVHSALHDLMGRLPARLRYIIIARYGLAGDPAATYGEIGAALGLSGERGRQLHTEALVRLRHPAHSQHLRSLLDRHTLADYEEADAQAQRWLRQRGGRHGR